MLGVTLFFRKTAIIALIAVFSLSFPGSSLAAEDLAASTSSVDDENQGLNIQETQSDAVSAPTSTDDSSAQTTDNQANTDQPSKKQTNETAQTTDDSDAAPVETTVAQSENDEFVDLTEEPVTEKEQAGPTIEIDNDETPTEEADIDIETDNFEILIREQLPTQEVIDNPVIAETEEDTQEQTTQETNHETADNPNQINSAKQPQEQTRQEPQEISQEQIAQDRERAARDEEELIRQETELNRKEKDRKLRERLSTYIAPEPELPQAEGYDPSIVTEGTKDFSGIVRQSTPYTCGQAALATLFTQFGIPTTEGDILKLAPADKEKGVSLYALKQAAIALGQQTYLKKWTPEQLRQYVNDTGSPVLIHDIQENVGGHYSVARKFHQKDGQTIVTLLDTEAGNIELSWEDFVKMYNGYVLVIVDEDPSGQDIGIQTTDTDTSAAIEETVKEGVKENTEESSVNSEEIATERSTEKSEEETKQAETNNNTHPLLADTATDVSDEEAKTIWGKYVPVYLTMKDMGGEEARIANKFMACRARIGGNAWQSVYNPQKQAEREQKLNACYQQFREDLRSANINMFKVAALNKADNAKETTDNLFRSKAHDRDAQAAFIANDPFIKELLKLAEKYDNYQEIYGPIYVYWQKRYADIADRYQRDIQTLQKKIDDIRNESITFQGKILSLGEAQNLVRAKTAQLNEINRQIQAKYRDKQKQSAYLNQKIASYEREIKRYRSLIQNTEREISDYQSGKKTYLTSSDRDKINQAQRDIRDYQNKIRDYKRKSEVDNPYYLRKAKSFDREAAQAERSAKYYEKRSSKYQRKADSYYHKKRSYDSRANSYESTYKYYYKKYKKYKKKYKKKRKWRYKWRYRYYGYYARAYEKVYRYYQRKASRANGKYYSYRSKADSYARAAGAQRNAQRYYKRLAERYRDYARRYKVNSNRYRIQIAYYERKIDRKNKTIAKIKQDSLNRKVAQLNVQIAAYKRWIAYWRNRIDSERRNATTAIDNQINTLNGRRTAVQRELNALRRELAVNRHGEIFRIEQQIERLKQKVSRSRYYSSSYGRYINYYGNFATKARTAIQKETELIKKRDKELEEIVKEGAREEVRQFTVKVGNEVKDYSYGLYNASAGVKELTEGFAKLQLAQNQEEIQEAERLLNSGTKRLEQDGEKILQALQTVDNVADAATVASLASAPVNMGTGILVAGGVKGVQKVTVSSLKKKLKEYIGNGGVGKLKERVAGSVGEARGRLGLKSAIKITEVSLKNLPKNVQESYKLWKSNGWKPGSRQNMKGGQEFENRINRTTRRKELPEKPSGYYKEYDVNPKKIGTDKRFGKVRNWKKW